MHILNNKILWKAIHDQVSLNRKLTLGTNTRIWDTYSLAALSIMKTASFTVDWLLSAGNGDRVGGPYLILNVLTLH